MCDVRLEGLVSDVVSKFMNDGQLFTALDVSNYVKQCEPSYRHKDVRDVVRSLWGSAISTNGYGRTPINVTLPDGSVANALLYHPLADAWDLDSKYDSQKRTQTAARPQHTAVVVNAPVSTQSTVLGTVDPVVSSQPAPTTLVDAVKATNQKMAHFDIWNQLFQSQPSLFPRQ